ncbi:recombinase family protein [Streptomyces sp. NBC_01591]|uniref:recombinase family protein n=1 Tax=Streptomyces sp. NBC_01591 TaxID=2975888 RepID=UPI002DDBBDA2|nr:recombinase family protein [Streptomyces sp. NBC_01591]WSD72547.1 recombinase family protein [Streptomyces sp. NBC_01591]
MLAGPCQASTTTGPGKLLFAFFAAMAAVEREFIHERTLIGLDTAAANGNNGGRPPAIDGDMLAVALRRRTRKSQSPLSPSTSASAAPPCTAPSPHTTKPPQPLAAGG